MVINVYSVLATYDKFFRLKNYRSRELGNRTVFLVEIQPTLVLTRNCCHPLTDLESSLFIGDESRITLLIINRESQNLSRLAYRQNAAVKYLTLG